MKLFHQIFFIGVSARCEYGYFIQSEGKACGAGSVMLDQHAAVHTLEMCKDKIDGNPRHVSYQAATDTCNMYATCVLTDHTDPADQWTVVQCASPCDDNHGGCDANSDCTVNGGSWTQAGTVECTCKAGFTADGDACLPDGKR